MRDIWQHIPEPVKRGTGIVLVAALPFGEVACANPIQHTKTEERNSQGIFTPSERPINWDGIGIVSGLLDDSLQIDYLMHDSNAGNRTVPKTTQFSGVRGAIVKRESTMRPEDEEHIYPQWAINDLGKDGAIIVIQKSQKNGLYAVFVGVGTAPALNDLPEKISGRENQDKMAEIVEQGLKDIRLYSTDPQSMKRYPSF